MQILIALRDRGKYKNLKCLQNKSHFTCKSTNFLIQIRFRHYLCYCLPLCNVEIKFELIDPYHLMRSTMYIHTFMGTIIITHLRPFSLLSLFHACCTLVVCAYTRKLQMYYFVVSSVEIVVVSLTFHIDFIFCLINNLRMWTRVSNLDTMCKMKISIK